MVKRISCRVISSVPFSETSAGLLSIRQVNNNRHEVGGVAAADLRLKHNGNLANDAKSFYIGLETLNDFPIGQILDCYA